MENFVICYMSTIMTECMWQLCTRVTYLGFKEKVCKNVSCLSKIVKTYLSRYIFLGVITNLTIKLMQTFNVALRGKNWIANFVILIGSLMNYVTSRRGKVQPFCDLSLSMF